MGAKHSNGGLSRDQQKLNSFYVPNVTEKKINVLEVQARKLKIKYLYKSLIFGFVLQYFLGVSEIYENINKKSTLRRLNAKKKEDEQLGIKRESKSQRIQKQTA